MTSSRASSIGLADLGDQDLRDRLGALGEHGVDLAHDLDPLDDGQCGPPRLRRAGGLNGCLHILRRRTT